MKKWDEEKPWLVMASPPCKMLSTLQNLSIDKRDENEVRKKLEEAVKHLAFAVFLCLKQAEEGTKFVFEHPVRASSWQLALVNKLLQPMAAERVNFDFCTFGMTMMEAGTTIPVKKRTSVVTNCPSLVAPARPASMLWHAQACHGGERKSQCMRSLS